jgi:hypothetical protein
MEDAELVRALVRLASSVACRLSRCRASGSLLLCRWYCVRWRVAWSTDRCVRCDGGDRHAGLRGGARHRALVRSGRHCTILTRRVRVRTGETTFRRRRSTLRSRTRARCSTLRCERSATLSSRRSRSSSRLLPMRAVNAQCAGSRRVWADAVLTCRWAARVPLAPLRSKANLRVSHDTETPMRLFESIDADGNGFIESPSQLACDPFLARDAHREWFLQRDNIEVRHYLFVYYDIDSDGRVDAHDFVEAFRERSAALVRVREQFRRLQRQQDAHDECVAVLSLFVVRCVARAAPRWRHDCLPPSISIAPERSTSKNF